MCKCKSSLKMGTLSSTLSAYTLNFSGQYTFKCFGLMTWYGSCGCCQMKGILRHCTVVPSDIASGESSRQYTSCDFPKSLLDTPTEELHSFTPPPVSNWMHCDDCVTTFFINSAGTPCWQNARLEDMFLPAPESQMYSMGNVFPTTGFDEVGAAA